MMKSDTIAAISTGLTESGIGIVRISGPDSFTIAKKVFRTKSGKICEFEDSHRIRYGTIVSPASDVSRETLDEVLISNMKAPHTYTGEDTIEINCHGGVLMMRRILTCVLGQGCRLAEPGEFTKRAFLNGRIDLTQAEAVAGIISAENEQAADNAIRQLKGSVSEIVRGMRSGLLEKTAYIEAALDDPEHINLSGFHEEFLSFLENVSERLQHLIDTAGEGKLIREGINTVILGKPNAGKSSLMNALLEEERAIVTEIAGTTRDTLEEHLNIGGITLNITDTAGIHDTSEVIEQIGVERARKKAGEADLILAVFDASRKIEEEDRQITAILNKLRIPKIYIINKCDVTDNTSVELESWLKDVCGNETILRVSAKKRLEIETIKDTVRSQFMNGLLKFDEQVIITSERQKHLLVDTRTAINNVRQAVKDNLSEDFYTVDLMDAIDSLGRIIGENTDEALINEIFSKFCMGK